MGYTYLAFNVSATTCGTVFGIAQSVFFSKWYFATNDTLFSFENDLINGQSSAGQSYYPYGDSSLNNEVNDFESFDFSPLLGSQFQTSSQRLLALLHYSNITQSSRFPTSFQLSNKLDINNLLSNITFSQEVTTANQPITVNITGLTPNTVYNIYISYRNNYPVSSLLDDRYVAQVNVKTLRLISEITSPAQHIQCPRDFHSVRDRPWVPNMCSCS